MRFGFPDSDREMADVVSHDARLRHEVRIDRMDNDWLLSHRPTSLPSEFAHVEIVHNRERRSEKALIKSAVTTTNLGASPAFDRAIRLSIDALPRQLKDALHGYVIYTSAYAEQFILEGRNRGLKNMDDIEQRIAVRQNGSMTLPDAGIQNFTEWVTLDGAGRAVNFFEFQTLKGAVAHEAEHALDAKLGFPSANDAGFDASFRQDAASIQAQRPTSVQNGWLQYYLGYDPMTNDVDSEQGKSELFAELGAVYRTGETSNPVIPARQLLEFFPKAAHYVQQKIDAGEW